MKTLVKATILGEVVMAAEGVNFVADCGIYPRVRFGEVAMANINRG